MAYMDQENKKSKAFAVKTLLKQYNLKGSLSVDNYSTLVLTITEGSIDFVDSFNRCGLNGYRASEFRPCTNGHIQVNEYWYHEHFDGKAREFLGKAIGQMNIGNHDNSNAQIDHFDKGWFLSINIGRWNKPYQLKI